MVANSQSSGLPLGQTVRTLQPGEDQVSVDDTELLLSGEYSREGDDLIISLDGRTLVITEYFNSDNPPDLVAPNGSKLESDTVSALAGPLGPSQYAQISGGSDLIEIGTVQTVEGTATSTQVNGTEVVLAEGDPVYQGDVIETGEDSKLGIAFIDKTVFSISANARMVLDELVFDPNESENNSMVFNLVEGGFVFLTGEIAPSGNMEMKTPGGTMGIRGTMPNVQIDPSTGTEEHSVGIEPTGETGTYILTINGQSFVVEGKDDKWVVSSTGQVTVVGKSPFDVMFEEDELDFIELVLAKLNEQAFEDGVPTRNTIEFATTSGTAIFVASDTSGDDGFEFSQVGADQNGADKDDPPVTVPDTYAIDEDSNLIGANVISGSGAGPDFDPDGFSLKVVAINGQPLTFVNGIATVQLPPSADVVAGSGGTVGAVLEITPDGQFNYFVGNVYQYLAIDESAVDSFTYTVEDKNGFTTTETVTITIGGNNDSPDIVVDPGVPTDSAAEGLDETDAPLSVSGTLSLSDVDITDIVEAEVLNVTINPASTGPAGSHPDLATLKAMMTLEQSTIIDGDETTGQIIWTFDSEDSADPTQEPFDYLADGETLILDYVVFQALDDSGSDGSGNDEVPFDEQIVTITITGTNDQPLIDFITSTGTLTEVAGSGDGALPNAQGIINLSDDDDTDTVTLTEVFNDDMVWNSDNGPVAVDVVNGNSTVPDQLTPAQIQALIDGFVLNDTNPLQIDDVTNTANSGWLYSTGVDLNFLAQGESIVFSFDVTVTDDSGVGDNPALGEKDSDTKTVTITINGTNDIPVVEGVVDGSDFNADLTEDAGDGFGATETTAGDASGKIIISDLDDTDQVQLEAVYQNDMAWSGGTGGAVTSDQLTQAQIDALIAGFSIDGVAVNSATGEALTALEATAPGSTATHSNTNTAEVDWLYQTGVDLNFLAQGETLIFSYTVQAKDDNGAVSDAPLETVTITIHGTNDIPIVEGVVDGSDFAADLTEVAGTNSGASETTAGDATGKIVISDLDDTDQVQLEAVYQNDMGWSGGAITADQLSQAQIDALIEGFSIDTVAVDATTGIALSALENTAPDNTATHANTNTADVDWLYQTGVDLNFLADGETLTFSYTVQAKDDNGAVSDAPLETVTITITGTNDVPVLEAASSDLTADLTEVLGPGTGASETSASDAAGTITISDLDDTDTVKLSESYDGNITWNGGGTITDELTSTEIDALIDGLVLANLDAANSNNGNSDSVTTALTIDDTTNDVTTDWTYSTNVDLNFLGKDETITFSYTLTPTDDSGTGTAIGTPQTLSITLRGTNDTPDITVTGTEDQGAVTEDVATVSDNPNTAAVETEGEFLTDNGTISFADLDATDTSDATVALKAGGISYSAGVTPSGALDTALANAMKLTGDILDANGGNITWTFALDNALAQYLADGESVTATYVITVMDDSGAGAGDAVNETDTVTQEITVTINGTNDQPDVTTQTDVAETFDEGNAALSTSGSFDIEDVDTTDTDIVLNITVGATGNTSGAPADLLALFTAEKSQTIIDGSSTTGTVDWTFDAVAGAFDYLAHDESVVITYTVTLEDDSNVGAGGSGNEPDSQTQLVVITINGDNDQPVVTAQTDVAETFDEGNAALSTTGSFNIQDVDTSDIVTVTDITVGTTGNASGAPADLLALFTAELNQTIIDGSSTTGTIDWTFDAAAGDFDYLADGDSIEITYTIEFSDDSTTGGSGTDEPVSNTQTVVITIDGENDIPTLTAFSAPIDTTDEDTQVELTFAELNAQGNEADVDGTVDAYVVQAVTTGTLLIGADAGSATAFQAGVNDTIDATNKAYWTPAQDANGTLDAFTVVAKDDFGAESSTPIQAQVTVNPVNDAPQIALVPPVMNLVETSNDTGSGNQQQFAGTILSTDLINDGSPSLASVDVTNYTPHDPGTTISEQPGTPDFVLNDGANGADSDGNNNGGSAFDVDGDFQVTYNLDLTSNPLGYDLTRITTYAAHSDNRTAQEYEVFVDYVDDGLGNFVSLGTFTGDNAGGVNQASRLILENSVNPGTDPFATGVAAIRFDMDTPLPNASTVWREIDVEGTATVPFATEDTVAIVSGVQISDVDAGSDPVEVTLNVNNGATVNITDLTGLTVTDAGDDAQMIVTGTVAALNAAFANSIAVTPAADFDGTVTLSVTVNDQGNNGADPGAGGTGDGSSEEATANYNIDFTPVNDAPVFNTPTQPLTIIPFTSTVRPAETYGTIGTGETLTGEVIYDPLTDQFVSITISHATEGSITSENVTFNVINDGAGTNPDSITISGTNVTGSLGGIVPGTGAITLSFLGPDTILDSTDLPEDLAVFNLFPDRILGLPAPTNPNATTGIADIAPLTTEQDIVSQIFGGYDETTGEVSGQFDASDVDGDPLTFGLVSNGTEGIAVVNADGTYTYTPTGGPLTTDDSFVVSVTDSIDTTTATVFLGTSGENDLDGTTGVDFMHGGGTFSTSDFDDLFGNDGDDLLVILGGGIMTGGAGNDTMRGLNIGDDTIDGAFVDYRSDPAGIIANLTDDVNEGIAGGDNVNGFLIQDGYGDTDNIAGVSFLYGSNFNDKIFVDDTYLGNYGNWVEVRPGAGDDQVTFTNVDNARISYRNDVNAVEINMTDGTATDRNAGDTGIGNDTFSGANQARGSSFNDLINGSSNSERLRGHDGDDEINGGGGNDRLEGEDGNDILVGGDLSDILIGGEGMDTMTGGLGADEFVLLASTDGTLEIDSILDYENTSNGDASDDVIDIESLLDDAFGDGHSFAAGDLSFQSDGSGGTRMFVNTTGTPTEVAQLDNIVENDWLKIAHADGETAVQVAYATIT